MALRRKHVIPTSGEEVYIKPVSMFLAEDIRASFPPPTRPVARIETPEGFTEVPEQGGPAIEQYERDLEKWETEVNRRMVEEILLDGCDFELNDTQREEVKRFKERKKRRGITIQQEEDKLVYIMYLMCPGADDLQQLQEKIIGLDQATKERLEEAQRNFRGQVQG